MSAALLQKDPIAGIFSLILWNFSEQFINRIKRVASIASAL